MLRTSLAAIAIVVSGLGFITCVISTNAVLAQTSRTTAANLRQRLESQRREIKENQRKIDAQRQQIPRYRADKTSDEPLIGYRLKRHGLFPEPCPLPGYVWYLLSGCQPDDVIVLYHGRLPAKQDAINSETLPR